MKNYNYLWQTQFFNYSQHIMFIGLYFIRNKKSMQRFVIVTSLFLYITGIAVAQQWTTYTTANSGLVDNTVKAVCIDSYGVKWFGTPAGLSRFDGSNWVTFSNFKLENAEKRYSIDDFCVTFVK